MPTLTVDQTPLGFVLFVLQMLAADFERARARLSQHVEEAKASRQGTSQWAQQEVEDLDRFQARLVGASMQLAPCRLRGENERGLLVAIDLENMAKYAKEDRINLM